MRIFKFFYVIAIILVACNNPKQNASNNTSDSTSVNYSSDPQTHFDLVIAHKEGDTWILDLPLDTMRNQWNVALENGGVEKMNFDSITITNDSGNYMLLGKNNDNYRQAGISLVLDKDELYEESYYFEEPMSNTVTCTGCATGCHPSMKNKKGICWPPCDPCTKTETLQAGPIFSKSGK